MINKPISLPRVIAHRGSSGTAPENTKAAFREAKRAGATWVELDANISSDGIPYVHHDDTITRCSNGTGFLIAQPSTCIDQLDAGSWFDPEFTNEPLPRLEAVIALLVEHRMGLNLEIKPSAGWEIPTTEAICHLITQQWPEDLPLLVSSFSEKAMQVAALHLKQATRGLIVCAIPPDWKELMAQLDCQTLHCSAELLSKAQAEQIKDAGFGLLCWTVNESRDAARLFDWGVDSVFSDYPGRILEDLDIAPDRL